MEWQSHEVCESAWVTNMQDSNIKKASHPNTFEETQISKITRVTLQWHRFRASSITSTHPHVTPHARGNGLHQFGPVQIIKRPRIVSLINRRGILFQGASSFLYRTVLMVESQDALTLKGVHGSVKEPDLPCKLSCHLTTWPPQQQCVFPLQCWKCLSDFDWFLHLFAFVKEKRCTVTVGVSLL